MFLRSGLLPFSTPSRIRSSYPRSHTHTSLLAPMYPQKQALDMEGSQLKKMAAYRAELDAEREAMLAKVVVV